MAYSESDFDASQMLFIDNGYSFSFQCVSEACYFALKAAPGESLTALIWAVCYFSSSLDSHACFENLERTIGRDPLSISFGWSEVIVLV